MLDIFGGISSVANSVTGFFGNSFKSPLWTAIIISVLVMLILLLFYPAKRGMGPTKQIKVLIYVFLISAGILYMHDSTLKSIWNEEHKNKVVEETLGGLRQHINGGTSLMAALGGTTTIAPQPQLPPATGLPNPIGGTSFDNVTLKL